MFSRDRDHVRQMDVVSCVPGSSGTRRCRGLSCMKEDMEAYAEACTQMARVA